MAKKLTQEKCDEIMETGIREFAALGYDGANTNTIARKAGISVGVLFKYYGNKEGFFHACLQRSLDVLSSVLQQVEAAQTAPRDTMETLLRALIRFSRQHGDYIRMYHMITAAENSGLTGQLTEQIEGASARVYGAYMARLQHSGQVRRDIPPETAAFFLDNMLMMLQLTYSCDYYKKRLKLYIGCDADDTETDETMIRQTLLLIDRALCVGEKTEEPYGICTGV